MDKKFIHIDELIKRKLSQEHDTNGIHDSWAKMEQMLDQSNQRTAAGFWSNGKRLIPLLLLLVTTGVIGYTLLREESSDTQKAVAASPAQGAVPPSTSDLSHSSATEQSKDAPIDQPIYTVAKAAVEAQNAGESHTIAAQFKQAEAHTPKTNSKASKSPQRQLQAVVVQEAPSTLLTTSDKGKLTAIPSDEVLLASVDKPGVTAPILINSPVPSNLAAVKKQVEKSLQQNEIFVDNDNNIVKKKESYVTTTNIIERKVDDPIKKQTSLINDTISVVKHKKISFMPLSVEEIKVMKHLALIRVPNAEFSDNLALAKVPVAPVRQPINIKDDAQTISNATTNESSQLAEGKTTKGNATSLLASINNFFEIRKQFYATAFLGMNTTVNHWLPAGFQAGIGGHMWLNNSFTLGTELSYIFQPLQHNFVDKASRFTQTSPAIPTTGGYIINYDEHSTVRSYNINQVQQFEIPLMLGWHHKNWSFYAGPTLNAILPLSYFKMEYSTTESKMTTAQAPELNLTTTTLAAQPTDFDARLGLGYIAGANYNLNDRFAVQFRLNQILTDNAKSNISNQISSELFRYPTIRLGIQYRLSKSKRVMYMMDEKNR